MNKIFYHNGRQAILDILNYKIIKTKKIDENLYKFLDFYENKSKPTLPISADLLMTKYKIPEGRQLGIKLKMIEEEWVKNNFKISDQQVEYIVKD